MSLLCLGRAAVDALAPQRCAGCGEPAPGPLCPGCVELLCGSPLPPRLPHPDRRRVVAAFAFDGLVRRALHHGKYRGRSAVLRLVASLAAERIGPELLAGGAPQAIVAVPLGPRRRRARGYDQAEIAATQLARLPGCGLVAPGLVRCRETAAQVGRDAEQRRHNLEGAFAWRGRPLSAEAPVWVIDDISTTGATLAAAAAALQRGGAVRIERVAMARTL